MLYPYTPSFDVWCISIAAYLLTIGNTNLQQIDGWSCFLIRSIYFVTKFEVYDNECVGSIIIWPFLKI